MNAAIVFLSLINKGQGFCLDVVGNEGKPGDKVILWQCVPGPNDQDQLWVLNGKGELVNGAHKHCLGVEGSDGGKGRKVLIEACDGGADQRWEIHKKGSDRFELHNKAQNLCLDVPGKDGNTGEQLALWSCDGGTDQTWDWGGSVDIAGQWHWNDNVVVQIQRDGRMLGSNHHVGIWRALGGQRFELRWDAGWIDTLQLSSDGSHLSGSNQHGTIINASRGAAVTKVAAPVADPPPPEDESVFDALRDNVKATLSEISKRDIIIDYASKHLLTAAQLMELLDMFNSEVTKLQVARGVAKKVSDPEHAAAYGPKLRSSSHRVEFLKMFER